jgi:hypothetical protein
MSMLTRRTCNAWLTLLVIGVGIGSASAASVHFKQNRNPTFTDQGLALNAVGALVGLGNADLVINLSAALPRPAPIQEPVNTGRPDKIRLRSPLPVRNQYRLRRSRTEM